MLGNSPFYQEVSEVEKKGKRGVCNYFDVTIIVGKDKYKPLCVTQLSRYRDYIEDYAQQLIMTVQLNYNDHVKITSADVSDIKVNVVMYDINLNAPYSLQALFNPIEFTYKAKLLKIETTDKDQSSQITNMNVVGALTVKEMQFQLLEPSFESVSIKTVGTGFRNISGIDAIRTLLTNYSTEDDPDAITSVKGVNVVDGVATAVKEQIPVRHSTPLVQAIRLIIESCGGLYPTGSSYYLQDRLWYIFPPYDLTQFDKANRTITVVNLPKDRMPGIEKTFYNTKTKLIVLSTRDTVVVDGREGNKFNKGVAVRFMEAIKLFDGFGEVKNNKYAIDASKNVNEITIEDRTDKANILRPSVNRITSNKNRELTNLAKSNGFYMQVTWEHGDDSLLHPGMAAKILYLKDNKPASVKGTLIETETVWYPREKTFVNMKLQKMIAMTFFVGLEEFV